MLFGVVVKPGQKVSASADGGQVLHLSQACLNNPQSNSKTYLQLIDGESTINICALAKDKCEHASFDIFIPTDSGIKFSVEGSNEIHLSGYFEPDGDRTAFDFPDAEDESDEEAEEVEGEDDHENLIATATSLPGKKLPGLMPDKACKKGAKLAEQLKSSKVTKAPPADDDECSDDDDDGGSSDEDEMDQMKDAEMKKVLSKLQNSGSYGSDDGSSNGEDDDDDDDDVDHEAVMEAIKNARKAASAADGEQQTSGVKRKSSTNDNSAAQPPQPPKKQAKKMKEDQQTSSKPAAQPAGGDGATKFQQSLMEYVKAHGRTPVSQLGTQVKRPSTVKKLGAFIKERPHVFKVDNGHVSLVK